MLTELDRTIELLNEGETDKVRFKLAKLRIAIQKLISDESEARAALRAAQQGLQSENTRRIQTTQALNALQEDPGDALPRLRHRD